MQLFLTFYVKQKLHIYIYRPQVSSPAQGLIKFYKTEINVYLNVSLSFWHWSKVLQNLVVEADLEVLEPGTSLLIHLIMQLL